ncbi:hypothetical protein G5I_01206 [Acromyrmex echinatior]|uniref:Uncharacterized protein n=1 Tax=Acromyrmex echinatior TaxID=103372 RepID=F4W6Z8_ACREC|nr:hypothetical protein G5I_01206 [Acromyrmex echinatior]
MERKQRSGNANKRGSRRSYPGRNTAKIQKYKSTKRRGLTALTGVARQRSSLLQTLYCALAAEAALELAKQGVIDCSLICSSAMI